MACMFGDRVRRLQRAMSTCHNFRHCLLPSRNEVHAQ
jgi:hypothetical protein